MASITWLHLSDIHFRESYSYDQNIILKALIRDVPSCMHEFLLKPDFIIFSGDLAFASRREEYALAQQFLDDLLQVTAISKDRLFLIPGNHDIDRNAISTLAAGATTVLDNRDAVNRFLANDADRALVFHRFHNYQTFINDYLGQDRLPFDNTRYFYVKRIEVTRRQVAILGLNSAWLASSDKDRNQLLLGERQVRAALDAAQVADLRLAIMHHPFDWLQDFDRSDVEPLLCGGCHFVLHGHMHQVGLLHARTPDTEAIIIAAGACYEARQYPNSYNFVRLDLDAGTGTVYLRMYSDQQGGFWAKDVRNYRNVPDGMYTFRLPAPLRAAEPATVSKPDIMQTEMPPSDSKARSAASTSLGLHDANRNTPEPRGGENAVALLQVLINRFNAEELRTLCFDLQINYDNLHGEGKDAKARELVAYLQRRNQLDQLVSYIRRKRSDIKLP